ncbi:MAG: CD225/dispanin family protein [Muribaculaceae bacterium]|nr:CD225/dispanin family protein [Muribaculaceae bacterium]
MKKYWIIENGQPIGPFSAEELRVRRDFNRELPVWCNELPDWSTVGQLPELACLIEGEQQPEEATVVEEQQTVYETEQPHNDIRQPYINIMVNNAPEQINGIERPKSYMGWNIAALLCCCLPAAIVGLIFSSQVNRHWMRGDAQAAVRSSEYAQWAFIISFTLGLVSWPFQLLML